MRIVIDMQGMQASNSKRGIGRYISSFVKQLIYQNNNEFEIILLLNGMFKESISIVKNEFSNYISPENLKVWYSLSSISYLHTEDKRRIVVAEKIRENYIAKLDPDLVIVTSLFEGLVDDAAISINSYNEKKITTAVILYDLIPLIHEEVYLSNPIVKDWYLKKIAQLKKSDFILSISESSRNEAITYLNYDKDCIHNISSAANTFFKIKNYSEAQFAEFQKKYGINKKFILYTGGIDFRKNIERLIESFSLLVNTTRDDYQLAIVCSISDTELYNLKQLCNRYSLNQNEVIFTGYISEEDLLAFYNLCDFFIFPSWHEGFGLPILEAMQCGKAVIGGKYSSIPEVINNERALFDPYDINSIAQSMLSLISDIKIKTQLEEHSKKQAKNFSWELTANRAWQVISNYINIDFPRKLTIIKQPLKKLAYFSPLPPARSGIAGYSAELLKELINYYDIDVIICDDEEVNDEYIKANCAIKSINWFKCNHNKYERVLYHFGNSSYHWHMFGLLNDYPGIIVLHDYYLSGIVAHMDLHMRHTNNGWEKELFKSGGWNAVYERFNAKDTADVIYKYPCNLSILQNCLGVISHSHYAKNLAVNNYQYLNNINWDVIPLLRMPAINNDKRSSRLHLGIDENAIIICSFGFMGPTKLNEELIKAWLDSPMSKDDRCFLVFAGEKPEGIYEQLIQKLRNRSKKIIITGWLSNNDYKHWLSAADIGVQLRTKSRGESSAAVLDCMNYGLALIINANGSMSEIKDDCVLKIPDDFTQLELQQALEKLYYDNNFRAEISNAAIIELRERHNPRVCTQHYVTTIEKIYNKGSLQPHKLIHDICNTYDCSNDELKELCQSIANNYPPEPRRKSFFVDVSELIQRDAKSGIQRVVREVINQLLRTPPEGWNVELVYASKESNGYFYARKYSCKLLSLPDHWAVDGPIDYYPGDVFLGLDLQPEIVNAQFSYVQNMKDKGVVVKYVVYDLLPVNHPEFFFPGARETYHNWFSKITAFDGAICISNSVASELSLWMSEYVPDRLSRFSIENFHLGADLAKSNEENIQDEIDDIILSLKNKTLFLVVSTIEPRKQHEEILTAFDTLWNQKNDVALIFVGKQGWMVDDLINKINSHQQLNKNFYWFSSIDDNQLKKIYAAADCLICASKGEGFGLPLIEAAQFKLPVIARDIPVFREVAGDSVFYFTGGSLQITNAVKDWLLLRENNKIPNIEDLQWLTWSQSTDKLVTLALKSVE